LTSCQLERYLSPLKIVEINVVSQVDEEEKTQKKYA